MQSDTTYQSTTTFVNDKTYYLRIRSKNNDGYWNGARTLFTYRFDNNPPNTFDITFPDNNAWTSPLPTFSWNSAYDPESGLFYYQLWIDNNLVLDSLPTYPRSITLPDSLALAANWHTWYMKAVDKAGNTSQSNQTRAIRVDATVPAAFNILAPQNNLWLNTTQPQFSWQASSDPGGSGLSNYVLKIDSTIFMDNISPDSTSVVPDYEIEQGEHIWQINAVDNVGNTQHSNEEWVVKIDSWGPGKQYITGLKGNYFNGTNFNSYVTSRIDANINYHNSNRPAGVNYSSNSVRWTGEISAPTNGVYNLRINHDDGVRLWINNDLVFNYWSNWNNGNHQTTYSFVSKAWVSFKLEYFNGPQAGYVKLYWTPPGGSEELIPTQYFRTSLTDFNLVSPAHYQWVAESSPTFTWNRTEDLGIGWEKYQLYLDGSINTDNISDTIYTITDTLSHGNHTWFVKSLDSLGNSSQSNQSWTVRIDNIAPNAFNLIAPAQDSITLTPVPDFSWQSTWDQGSGMNHFELLIDDAIDRDNIPYNTTTVQPSFPLNEGRHSWAVLAVDNVGNITSTDTIGFWIEYNNPPNAFNLISPINNDTLYTDLPTFLWHSSSDIGSGIKKYEVYVGNTKIGQTQDTTFTSVSPQTNGPHSWHVIAYDGINLSTSSNIEYFYVNKDNVGPVTEITDPIDGQIISSSSYLISGNVYDNAGGSGVDSVFISTDGGTTWQPVETLTKVNQEDFTTFFMADQNLEKQSDKKLIATWSHTWTDYIDSTHSIFVKAVDHSGNWGMQDNISVLVDRTAPVVRSCLISPITVSADTVSIEVIFDESGSGLDSAYPPDVTITPVNDSPFSVTQISYNTQTKIWKGEALINLGLNSGIARIEIDAARDIAGNIMSMNNNYSFLIDQDPPEPFTLVNPDTGAWINNHRPFFIWNSSSDSLSGLEHYELFVNNLYAGSILWQDTSVISPFVLDDGMHTWFLRAKDSAGNFRASTVNTFNIDSTGPNVQFIYPQQDDTLQLGWITVKGTADDGSGIGVDSVFLSFNDGVSWMPVNNDSLNFTSWSFNWQIDAKGTYTISSEGRDLLGTYSLNSTEINIIIPNSNPYIVASIDDKTYGEDVDTTIIVQNLNNVFRDADDDPLTFSAVSPDSNLYFHILGDSALSFKPAPDYFNQCMVVVSANDGDGGLVADSFFINILPINDPPQIIDLPDSLIFPNDAIIQLIMSDYEYDVDTPDSLLSWSFRTDNDSLIAMYNDTTFTLSISAPNFQGYGWLFCTLTDDSNAVDNDSILIHVDIASNIGSVEEFGIPKTFQMSQNYPNPFNPQTTIVYGLPRRSLVNITVFDVLGRKITTLVDETKEAGYHSIKLDASDFSSSLYFYRIQAEQFQQVRKMLLLK